MEIYITHVKPLLMKNEVEGFKSIILFFFRKLNNAFFQMAFLNLIYIDFYPHIFPTIFSYNPMNNRAETWPLFKRIAYLLNKKRKSGCEIVKRME